MATGGAAGSGQGGGQGGKMTGSDAGVGGQVGGADAGIVRRDGGATGGAGGTGDAGSSGGVSYSKDIQPLLNANCTSCHASPGPSGGVDLTNYTSVKKNASRANSEIQAGAMPPTGALSSANKQLFQSWVTAGAPNN
jgi:hypothetical protein